MIKHARIQHMREMKADGFAAIISAGYAFDDNGIEAHADDGNEQCGAGERPIKFTKYFLRKVTRADIKCQQSQALVKYHLNGAG